MEKRISGHTQLMGLFGSPIGHSVSPLMYNFSFEHDGLDYAYMAFEVTEEQMPKAFEAVRTLNIKCGNITMPCKNIAATLVDKLSPSAEIVGACNAFVYEDGIITGHITDGIGFVKNLEDHGVSVEGKNVVILGAGGAATAMHVETVFHGSKSLSIFNVKDAFFDKALNTKKKLEEKVPDCKVEVYDLQDKAKLEEVIRASDIVANATIMGMKPYEDVSLVDPSWLTKEQVVADAVYNPLITKLLKEAQEVGCKIVAGEGMMLQQGIVNYELFVGGKLPAEEFKKYRAEVSKS